MFTANSKFEAELKKRVEEELARLREILELGHAVKSYDQYQNLIGKIHALKEVMHTYCAEANTAINKER